MLDYREISILLGINGGHVKGKIRWPNLLETSLIFYQKSRPSLQTEMSSLRSLNLCTGGSKRRHDIDYIACYVKCTWMTNCSFPWNRSGYGRNCRFFICFDWPLYFELVWAMSVFAVTSCHVLCTVWFVPLKIRRGKSPFLGGRKVGEYFSCGTVPLTTGISNALGGQLRCYVSLCVCVCVTKPLP